MPLPLDFTYVGVVVVLAFSIGFISGRAHGLARRRVVWVEPPPKSVRERDDDPLLHAPARIEDAGVELLIRQGQWIDAIKRQRELSGMGLKEAKDLVDARRRELGT